jgi:hypothetical protein
MGPALAGIGRDEAAILSVVLFDAGPDNSNRRFILLIRVGAFTPMRTQWPHAIGPVFGDIRIIEKPIFKEDSWRFWNVRRTEEEGALERSHWLCIESDCEWHERAQVLDCHTTTL